MTAPKEIECTHLIPMRYADEGFSAKLFIPEKILVIYDHADKPYNSKGGVDSLDWAEEVLQDGGCYR